MPVSNAKKFKLGHYPGPWELDSAKDGDLRYQIVNGQVPKGINGDFGYPVCDTMNRHHCIAPEEDEANARLIAAAPELLEALEAIFEGAEYQRGTTYELSTRLLEKAQLAIAKAKGSVPSPGTQTQQPQKE
jgi:hypothetical protein